LQAVCAPNTKKFRRTILRNTPFQAYSDKTVDGERSCCRAAGDPNPAPADFSLGLDQE
jgi:hypothetical protein